MTSSKSSHSPPTGATIHQLKIKPIFDGLEQREKFYAHFLSRAAWHGNRIVMRQVSAESPLIFDLVMDLYQTCNGEYVPLCTVDGVYNELHKMVASKPNMRWKFVQPNTYINGEDIELKVYDESNRGIIQSWYERDV
ncbi:hypothetical protein P171DRAFT_472132 [Karstenula rhodostoma CBS 690.94]|uniref:Uncharacterized protein n=1 Tax=Karstenula rhodostoma CBS 690.94 TaxID=1392251 RepID=A0A9P4PLZ5_9PLEO|nr:hypothetical protein P171DRAFT_472132 [Karstenula rhodostoma CBS 690.94]